MTKLKNCKDCVYKKCLYKTDEEFETCPVEKKKQELIEKDNRQQ
jgi:translation elongation factor P/translation initiation factor 5A